MSKIVTAARTISEDPAVDGFGHHNPQLGQEDDLFYNALSVDRFMEGFFRGRDCQGHSSLDTPSELNPPQRIPSPLSALLVPQAKG